MSEKEIIKKIEKIIKHFESQEYILNGQKIYEYIQGLLDLYKKEKSLNKIIKSKTVKDICYNIGEFDNRFISKEELNKAIKELQDKLGIAEELEDKI
jgi:hypothetical protein